MQKIIKKDIFFFFIQIDHMSPGEATAGDECLSGHMVVSCKALKEIYINSVAS